METRFDRDAEMSSKRREEIQAIRDRGPLALAGSQLVGMKSTMMTSGDDRSAWGQSRRKVADLVERGKLFVENEQYITKRKTEKERA